MTRKTLIKKYKNLFWYFDSATIENMSDSVMVEFILNYGDWKAFQNLVKVLGEQQVALLFKKLAAKKRANLQPEIINYFKLFFQYHASQYSKQRAV